MVRTRGVLPFSGQMAIFEDIFGCHAWWGGCGSGGLEARDAADHLAVPGQLPMAESYPTPNVIIAEDEKILIQALTQLTKSLGAHVVTRHTPRRNPFYNVHYVGNVLLMCSYDVL